MSYFSFPLFKNKFLYYCPKSLLRVFKMTIVAFYYF
uniref:Uncharacterized protein n=1 Tax=Anguilla anguilla TaxID=7936 RepID=A0A0E9RAA5_ANGAN